MRLLEVGIKNFKSLRDVTFKPGDLSVLIGPNGAGKSNLCEALDFIGEMYRTSLDEAMISHGGYEGLVYRGGGQSRQPIHFSVSAALDADDLKQSRGEQAGGDVLHNVTIRHQVTIDPGSGESDEPYYFNVESIQCEAIVKPGKQSEMVIRIARDGETIRVDTSEYMRSHLRRLPNVYDDSIDDFFETVISPNGTTPMLWTFETIILPAIPIRSSLGAMTVFDLSPSKLRELGVRTRTPRLNRDGSNFPPVLSSIKTHDPGAFGAIMGTLSTIMPTLQDVDVVKTAGDRLGLVFSEAGVDGLWTAADVSDGTVRALGLLTSLFNRGSKVVIVEEPENSLHPWAIGQFIEACRLASKTKQVILTTHSPVVVDQLKPEEVWVVAKPGAETSIDRLVDLDPVAQTGWEEGQFILSEYLDSGIVPGSVPAL